LFGDDFSAFIEEFGGLKGEFLEQKGIAYGGLDFGG
jgi:hypothetical protein